MLVIAGLIGWRAFRLGAFSLSNDEGAYLMWAWLVNSGHPLYSETVSVSAPLFIVLLDWMFSVTGVTLVAGRVLVLAFTALTMLTLVWMGRWLYRENHAHGWLAGVAAAAVIGIAPLAFTLSRMAMGEIPSVALATVAVALAMVYARRGNWVWLALSGLTFSLSLLVKAMNPLVVLPILWLVLTRHLPSHRSSAILAVAGWLLACLAPVIVCLFAYDTAALYDQVVAFRFELRSAFPWQLSQNLIWLRYFVRQHWGIVLLALSGIVLLSRRTRWDAMIPLGLWLGGALLTILTHSPLFPHHSVILLPPLALLAGLAVAETWYTVRKSAIGLVGCLAFLVTIPAAVQANQETLAASFGREADAITFLEQVTRPTDNVISDNLLLAFMAGRQSPPPLGDLAQVAISSGRQTSQRLIDISETYPVEAVADWALRLPHLAEYMSWVEDQYLVRRAWDNHHVIYFGRKVAAADVPHPRHTQFEDGIQLVGHDAWLEPTDAASWLQVTLYWTASRPPTSDHTVFVHLYDGAGNLVASHDGPPLFGHLPTGQWEPAEIIPDRHDIRLLVGPSPGEYRLVAGMYDLSTGDRLPVIDEQGTHIGEHTELERIIF